MVSCDLDTGATRRTAGLIILFSPCGERVPPDDEWTGFTECDAPLSRLSLAYYCIDCNDEGMSAGFPLISTHGSIVAGLGSTALPCLEAVTEAGDSVQAIWLGLRPPQEPLPDHVTGWWAEPDSLVADIITIALNDTVREKDLIIVGYDLGRQSLKTVRDSANKVKFVDPASLLSGSRAVFAAYPGHSVLILEPPPSLVTLAGSRLYWVAECPLLEPENTVVSLELDWYSALSDIVRRLMGGEGPEPGPTLGPYLRLVRHGEDIS